DGDSRVDLDDFDRRLLGQVTVGRDEPGAQVIDVHIGRGQLAGDPSQEKENAQEPCSKHAISCAKPQSGYFQSILPRSVVMPPWMMILRPALASLPPNQPSLNSTMRQSPAGASLISKLPSASVTAK